MRAGKAAEGAGLVARMVCPCLGIDLNKIISTMLICTSRITTLNKLLACRVGLAQGVKTTVKTFTRAAFSAAIWRVSFPDDSGKISGIESSTLGPPSALNLRLSPSSASIATPIATRAAIAGWSRLRRAARRFLSLLLVGRVSKLLPLFPLPPFFPASVAVISSVALAPLRRPLAPRSNQLAPVLPVR